MKRMNDFDKAELHHERYGNLNADDDVNIWYHVKRLIGAISFGLALLVLSCYLFSLAV